MIKGAKGLIRCMSSSARGWRFVPVRFGPSGIEHGVAEVLDCWPGEDHLYDDLYILRCDAAQNAWEVSVCREGEPSVPEGSGTVGSTVD